MVEVTQMFQPWTAPFTKTSVWREQDDSWQPWLRIESVVGLRPGTAESAGNGCCTKKVLANCIGLPALRKPEETTVYMA